MVNKVVVSFICIGIKLTHESINEENDIMSVIRETKEISMVDVLGSCWLGATARK